MKFVGRGHELSVLRKEYLRTPSFVLVTGRRRIGKTRMISEFIADVDSLYFFSNKVSAPVILEEFSAAVSGYAGTPGASYASWKGVFSAFARSRSGKKVLVIDEFQNMMRADPDLVPHLQDIWDNVLSKEDVMLILCGSHISVMESLDKTYDAPLYGRFTRHMRVGQLPFSDTGGEDFRDSVLRYSVHGGVPKYIELLGKEDLFECIRSEIMDPSAIMFDDPVTLLDDETKEPAGYMSIMKAIADGNHRISDIASRIQVPVTSLVRPLNRLMEMCLVRKDVPVTEKYDRSRNSLYMIADHYTAFWFRFVYPYMSALQTGNDSGAMANVRSHLVDRHASFVFEDICREQVYGMSDELGFVPRAVGRFWNRDTEIDVMAVDGDSKRAFVGECRFRLNTPVGVHELNELRKKCSGLKELDGYRITYGLFSVSGFDPALSGTDVLLVNGGIVVGRPGTD